MKTITPFANDSEAVSLGDLTIENGTDQVSLYGSLDMTRDKTGLKRARALKAAVDAIVAALEAEKDLPDKIAPSEKPQQVKNPFA
jgi:hypothetical protein